MIDARRSIRFARTPICMALAVLLMGAPTSSWSVELRRVVAFDIPTQPLSTALIRFGQQTGLQVVTLGQSLEEHTSPGIRGSHAIAEALSHILAGTGFTYRTVGEGTIALIGPESLTSRIPSKPQTPLHSMADLEATIAASSNRLKELPGELHTIVVTGTHIRGVRSAGSRVTVIDRHEIDSSGHATLEDVLKSLPGNFPGGLSEDHNADYYAGNYNYGTSINLRGLGTASTLVLVNGQRQPAGGVSGGFFDLSNIPCAAIERIELLTDGASAIYGSDAVGGVLNIVLRTNYEGAETRLRLGTAGGEADEMQVFQLFGGNWGTGNTLIGYHFHQRDALARAARTRTATGGDQRSFGGDDFRPVTSNPGNILNPITLEPAFAIPEGQNGRSLQLNDLLPNLINRYDSTRRVDVLPEREMHSVFMNLSQRLTERAELSAHGRFNKREIAAHAAGEWAGLVVPSTNPFFIDPFGQQPYVIVAYNFIDDFGPMLQRGYTETHSATLAGKVDMGGEWRLALAGTQGEERTSWHASNALNYETIPDALADSDPATAFNPFGDGSSTAPDTLDEIRTSLREHGVSSLRTINVIADGPVFGAPGGAAKLALGADYRIESLRYSGRFASSRSSRNTVSIFTELAVPLVGSENMRRGMRSVDVSLAGRFERRSDFGNTFNPKLGLRWQPMSGLVLRGAWGTSFRAPRLAEVDGMRPYSFSALLPVVDPLSSTGFSVALLRVGDNAGLKEETARIWTTGLELAPPGIPGASLSLAYFDIDYRDRVAFGGPQDDPLSILLEEHLWSSVIDRTPSQAEIDAVCAEARFLSHPVDCATTPPDLIVDFRYLNLASVKVRGIDFELSGRWDTDYGILRLNASGSYVSTFERAVSDTSPHFDIVGTLGHVPDLRMRGTVSWSRGGAGVRATVNHVTSFTDDRSRPMRRIDPWTTLDMRFSWCTSAGNLGPNELELALNAINLLDDSPPFVNIHAGYDTANADVLGRVISIQLTRSW